MKHLKKVRKFGRVKNQREAMINILLGNLILNEKIRTTEAKAKEIKGMIDKILNKAKKAKDQEKKVAVIRDLQKTLSKAAVKKLSGEFLEKFSKRSSGYARVIKLEPRKSDSARLAIIEFV